MHGTHRRDAARPTVLGVVHQLRAGGAAPPLPVLALAPPAPLDALLEIRRLDSTLSETEARAAAAAAARASAGAGAAAVIATAPLLAGVPAAIEPTAPLLPAREAVPPADGAALSPSRASPFSLSAADAARVRAIDSRLAALDK